MAVTYSAWNSAQISSSTSVTIASTTLPVGAYLVVTWQSSAANASATISDSAGGTWVTAIAFNNTNFATQTWIRTTVGTGSAFSVTCTGTSSAVHQAIGTYYQGASGSYSTSTTATGTTSFATVTTPAATNSGDLYYVNAGVTFASSSAPTWTAGSGFTLGSNLFFSGFGNRGFAVEYKSATSAATTTATMSVTGNTLSNNKLQSFVIYAQPVVNFTGWGAPI